MQSNVSFSSTILFLSMLVILTSASLPVRFHTIDFVLGAKTAVGVDLGNSLVHRSFEVFQIRS